MDVISPAAACPHCGLPLDATPLDGTPATPVAEPAPQPTLTESPAPAAPPAFTVLREPAAPPAFTVLREPAAPVVSTVAPPVEDEPEASDPWAAFAIDEPQYEPLDPAPSPEPMPVVAEFAPLFTRPDPESVAAPPAPPPVEEDPWITVAAPPAPAAVAEPVPAEPAAAETIVAARRQPATDHHAVIVDTGRGWGIRDGGAHEPAVAAVAEPAPLAEAAAPTPTTPRPSASPNRSLRLSITGVAVAVLVAVTYAGVQDGALSRVFGGRATVAAPAAIGSLTRVSGAQTDELLASVRARVPASSSAEAVAAVYGTGTTPKLVFVAYTGAATQTPDQLVATLNASGTPFTQAPTVSTVAGQPYVCGRVGAVPSPSVICTWADTHAAGFVYTLGSADVDGTLHLADVARTASEAAH